MSTTTNRTRPAATGPSPATLPVLLAAQLVIPMSIAGTAIALPGISDSLGSQPTALQWVINGFNVAFAIFTVVWGAASDRFGYRAAFRAGVALALVGAVVSTASTSLVMLDLARILAGIGAGAVITGASAIISNAYQGAARTKAFAAFGTINGLGLALGPSISGGLITTLGWRGVFGAQAIVLLAVMAGTLALPSIRHEPRSDRKILDLSLLRNREFTAMVLVPVAGAIGFVTLLTYLPNAMTAVLGLSAGSAGALMLAMTLPVLVAPLAVARLTTRSQRVRPVHVIFASLVFLILGDLGLLTVGPDAPVGILIVPMVMTGLGFGLPIGLIDAQALAAVPARLSGTAAGVLNLFRIGAEAIFVAAYAAILGSLIHGRIPDVAMADRTAAGIPGRAAAYAASLHPILIGMAILVPVLTIAVFALHRTAQRTKVPVAADSDPT